MCAPFPVATSRGGTKRGRGGAHGDLLPCPAPRGWRRTVRQVSWLPDLPTPGPSHAGNPLEGDPPRAVAHLRFRTRLQWRGPRRNHTGFPFADGGTSSPEAAPSPHRQFVKERPLAARVLRPRPGPL